MSVLLATESAATVDVGANRDGGEGERGERGGEGGGGEGDTLSGLLQPYVDHYLQAERSVEALINIR